MPRSARIDAPGALHHVIVRGIGRRKIFDDTTDRNAFLDRLGTILDETATACFAWALIPNHFHLLLRTGKVPLATVMRRLLTGYAMAYNRRHRWYGHLFQNRYKSILCQQEPYFLELVRYIHLNPLRSKQVDTLRQLDTFGFGGHSVLMGKRKNNWQQTDEVLLRFAPRVGSARKKYRDFVSKGVKLGRRPELTGGGLVRSAGGWSEVAALRRAKVYMKGDERILGDSDFVESVLQQNQEAFERRYRLKAKGINIETLAKRVSKLLDMPVKEVMSTGKYRHVVAARSLVCYWAATELDMSLSAMAKHFGVSATAISKSVLRGKKLAAENRFTLDDNEV